MLFFLNSFSLCNLNYNLGYQEWNSQNALHNTKTEKTLIRLLLQKRSDLGLHCLFRTFLAGKLVLEIFEHLLYFYHSQVDREPAGPGA